MKIFDSLAEWLRSTSSSLSHLVAFPLLLLAAGLVLAQPCVGTPFTFSDTGSLANERDSHTATLLPNGKVLVAGGYNDGSLASAELYDPASGTWTATGSLGAARYAHTATLLPNGKVLVAGGYDSSSFVFLASAELYDPASGIWTATGSLATARYAHTATLLPSGKVLVAVGSNGGGSTPSAELYDPGSGTWTATGSLATARYTHTATLLSNGKVLVAGGYNFVYFASAELYDPASGIWTATGSLGAVRGTHTATLLPNGKALVAGGYSSGATASAELCDPASGTWTATGSLGTARYAHTATLLQNGKVLIAGGLNESSSYLASAELYDPASGIWTATGSLGERRWFHTATLLPNGKVLVAGGSNSGGYLVSAELYDSGTATPAPVIISGTLSYCSNPVPGPVPNVTLILTGDATTSTMTDGSGNYQLSTLAPGGSYIVTPTKAGLAPGSAGINTVDVIAAQRHFLNLGTPLTGCQLTAADVNGDTAINTVDVIAIQRFFLTLTTGLANVGKYQFTPASRSYPGLVSNQTGQNYDALVFGDVASHFVERPDDDPLQDAADDGMSAAAVPAAVATLSLPNVAIDAFVTGFTVSVTTTAINAKNKLVGFQGDFTFDERVVTFRNEPVRKAGLTGGNWNVSGNVLPRAGPIRTLRISAYSNDFTPLSGSGTLFELRMTRVSQAAQGTALLWAAPPDNFIFIDADLNTQKPGNAEPGSVAHAGKRK